MNHFVTCLFSFCEEWLAPRPTPKLEDHPLSAVRTSLFNILAATLHVLRPSPHDDVSFPAAVCVTRVTARCRQRLASYSVGIKLLVVTKHSSLRTHPCNMFPLFAVPMTSSSTADANIDSGTRRRITTLCRHLETETVEGHWPPNWVTLLGSHTGQDIWQLRGKAERTAAHLRST
jgi:hypothetical protein